ncbi:DUF1697 domain-containing protein [Paraeggerthella sp. LCP19S3_G8]|uniref:DUF1697 domain-containing protein n=1 Tax=Paraeggerthella sp. LCP19S3_G8 TaxID=3440248 RepID=UPI002A8A3B52|nr:DUF1697 domain-containing protein [Paraeggerthella sp.]
MQVEHAQAIRIRILRLWEDVVSPQLGSLLRRSISQRHEQPHGRAPLSRIASKPCYCTAAKPLARTLSIGNDRIETMMRSCFGFAIPVLCMPKEALEDILQNAPAWWGGADKEIYDNLIFIMPPAAFSDVLHEIGEPKEGLERIEHYRNAIFWSFDRKEYRKTKWWSKTASARIGGKLTIRTANTVRKLAGM